MNEKKVTAGTVARTICLVLALLNSVLVQTGHPVLPIPDADINTLVSEAWVITAAVVAWWKNNSFSHAALEGDILKNKIKEQENGA